MATERAFDRRSVLEKGNQLDVFWSHSGVQDIMASVVGVETVADLRLSQERYEGFGSSVAIVQARKQDGWKDVAALRVPFVDTASKMPFQVGRSLITAGIPAGETLDELGSPGLLAIMAIVKNSDGVGVVKPRLAIEDICKAAFPLETVQIGELLELLPRGGNVLDLMNRGELVGEGLIGVYRSAANRLGWLHMSATVPKEFEKSWRRFSTVQPVYGRERLLEVSSHIDYGTGWASDSRGRHKAKPRIEEIIKNIVEKLEQIARLQISSEIRLVRAHGDFWEANWWLSSEDNQIYYFDQSLAFGPPGLDVAFAIGKRLISWLTKGDEDSKKVIEEFLTEYEEATGLIDEVKREMHTALAYKCVVGAIFDNFDDQTRRNLIQLAEAILDEKLSEPSEAFNLDKAAELWARI